MAFLFMMGSLPMAFAGGEDNYGINIDNDCLLDGSCQMSTYDAVKVKTDKSPSKRSSAMHYLQDIILGATQFIGTIVVLALIISGMMYVFSSVDSGLKKKAKDGMKYALIGMVIVMLALVIIRFVQFLAKGGG